MTAPHLTPIPGPAADFAARLRAALPALKTARCILRAPVLEDAPAWERIMVPDTQGHLGGPHDPDGVFVEFAATVGAWLLRGHGLWTVTDKAGAVLGPVLVGFEPGDREPELGWLFLPEVRGQGLAVDAAAAALDHALVAMALPSLVSYVASGNPGSSNLAQRPGARSAGSESTEIWRHAPTEAA